MNSSDIQPIPLEQLEQGVFPIVAVGGDARWHPVGTAFVIAVSEPKTALLLTAAHNLEYILQKIDAPHTQHHPTVAPDFRAERPSWIDLSHTHPYVVVRNGTSIALAEMVRSWCMVDFDVALMLVKIRPDDDADFPYRLALDSRPIKEGTAIMAVGCPSMIRDFTANYDTEDFLAELGIRLQTRVGRVIEVCPQGVSNKRWPGFLVDTLFDFGMSGGPVIDLSGAVPLVRGIVCFDMSEELEDGTKVAGTQGFASMLWLAMTIETQLTLVGEDGSLLVSENSRLLDIVRHGGVDDHGRAHEHVRVQQTASGLTCSWVSIGSEP